MVLNLGSVLCLLVVATLVRAEAHGLVADAEDNHVVMLQEAMTPSGKCADASEKTWQDCLNGEAIGFVKALDNGIGSLDDCKAAIMVNCFSIAGLTASYSRSNDACAWYDSCDMTSLANKDKDWRTGPAELKSDAMAVMVNAQDQFVLAKLSMMVCGTTCVCEGIDSCQGTCNYKCSPSQMIRPDIRAKGAGAAVILTTSDIQNPLKVCFSMGRGGGEWVWQNVQLVKNLNRFEIASAPGQNVVSSSLRDATSCRTLAEPCFTTSGPCAAPSVPAGTEPGLQAEYWQLDASCALPSNQVFDQQIPNLARLEATPQPLADLPFVQLAPAADEVSFAGSWKGAIKIKAAGTYTFYALSTGNVAVWVSGNSIAARTPSGTHRLRQLSAGQKVVSNIGCPAAVEISGTIDLKADSFPSLLVRFSHKGASAGLTLSYDGPDESSKVEIPAAVLWHHVPAQAPIKNVVLTVVGRGDVPHIEVCGTKSVMGSCKYNAGCAKTCATPTKLTHGKSYLSNSATTVSVPRGHNSDFLQKVTEVCFFFPSATVSTQFVWESVTVEGQLANDGTPFKIVPLANGAPISFVAVGTGHKQCQSGTFDDTSAFPYQVANNEVPDSEEEEDLS